MKKVIRHLFEEVDDDSPDEYLILTLLQQVHNQYVSFPLEECIELTRQKKFNLLKKTLESYFKDNTIIEESSSLEGLKTRLYFLEIQHSIVSQKLSELERQLWQFKQRYHQELQGYVSRLLDLKWEILAIKKEKDSSYENEYLEIEEERKKFNQYMHEESHNDIHHLNADEEKELQKLYRIASKLCHPDLVVDEFKQDAEKWFIELTHAYQMKNLEHVRWIYDQLNRGEIIFPKITQELSFRELLLASIRKLEKRIRDIEEQIQNIQQSSIYRNIIANPDLDFYFENLKNYFVSEIQALERELTLLQT